MQQRIPISGSVQKYREYHECWEKRAKSYISVLQTSLTRAVFQIIFFYQKKEKVYNQIPPCRCCKPRHQHKCPVCFHQKTSGFSVRLKPAASQNDAPCPSHNAHYKPQQPHTKGGMPANCDCCLVNSNTVQRYADDSESHRPPCVTHFGLELNRHFSNEAMSFCIELSS